MEHARRKGRSWRVDGVDVSAVAVEHARERAARLPAAARPAFTTLDVLRDPLPSGYDVVTCSLFLHHLSDADAVRLLARMRAAATSAVIVQDLLRSRAAMRLTWLVTRLFSRNPLILADGPLSVAAAFTLDEAAALARRAGLASMRVERRWPCRFVCTSRH
jgi:2-polyprenyl-3-methyl-5-hydroxy-6-metoxy-1,4-benzoquinol methylase